ncbi:unnamed protein product [Rotaria sp. Silwood2]|nr:unnamed protein product [Rotaria sp. Silwood2]CAF3185108.1 unnamed protein product [Rotaria sp. Silwood2]CAF3268892.1 unnamed protein product [Rotaria sp. Silwood2]CAF4406217.1 unnamed protein product [Rotaria sp. Silwood2]CAF4490732.1 unnamed protein product [Rotaria sp. Silwood2]
MGSYGLLLKNLCQARWYARYEALNAVYLSFHQIVKSLMELEHDGDTKSQYETKTLLNKMLSFKFVVLLIFIRQVMASTNATTTQLQQEDLDILSAIDILSSLLVLLKNMRNDDCRFIKITEVHVTCLILT